LAVQGAAVPFEVYSHETDPPVPAATQKEYGCVEKSAMTRTLEATIVTDVGDVDAGEHAPPVQSQLEKMWPGAGVAETDIWVP
jgi:hypothetical protein